ncbi:MAG TPA: glutathione S-transferase family protein [Polyangiales bacterium]|nr:glutathione S-transferase family protein [Polyangiales bacterium]
MSPPLTLLDFPPSPLEGWDSLSPFVLKVVRALRFAKLPFTQQHLPLISLPLKTPRGQLPVLHIGEHVLADSSAILQRIEGELAPGVFTAQLDARARSEAWLWEELADSALYPYALASRWEDEASWRRLRPAMFGAVPVALRAALASFVRRGIKANLVARDFTRSGLADCFARLDKVLDGLDARAPAQGFWMGDALSVADLGLFAQLHTLRAPFTPEVAAKVAQRATLSAYLDRVDAATVR